MYRPAGLRVCRIAASGHGRRKEIKESKRVAKMTSQLYLSLIVIYP